MCCVLCECIVRKLLQHGKTAREQFLLSVARTASYDRSSVVKYDKKIAKQFFFVLLAETSSCVRFVPLSDLLGKYVSLLFFDSEVEGKTPNTLYSQLLDGVVVR